MASPISRRQLLNRYVCPMNPSVPQVELYSLSDTPMAVLVLKSPSACGFGIHLSRSLCRLVKPSNAEAIFVLSTRMRRILKII